MDVSTVVDYLSKLKGKICLAYSGGVDSSLLAYLMTLAGVDFTAVMVVHEFISASRVEEAEEIAEKLGFRFLKLNLSATPEMLKNDRNRCYHCKRLMFSHLSKFGRIVDGTNASDLTEDRPGLRALREFNVLSPFVELGITKGEVRKIAKELNLDFYDRPSDSCLATRIEGRITQEKLEFVDVAERVAWKVVKRAKKLRVRVNDCVKVVLWL